MLRPFSTGATPAASPPLPGPSPDACLPVPATPTRPRSPRTMPSRRSRPSRATRRRSRSSAASPPARTSAASCGSTPRPPPPSSRGGTSQWRTRRCAPWWPRSRRPGGSGRPRTWCSRCGATGSRSASRRPTGFPGLFACALEVFDGMTREGGVRPDKCSFRVLVLGCCWEGRFEEVDALVMTMRQCGFCLDNATCHGVRARVLSAGMVQGFKHISELFGWMSGMSIPPNMVNYTAWIDSLCKRGYVKQAFHMLEKMVGKGLKPNVHTHTSLINGLCKIGWSERAFRLFLKLVRSSSYKPNVHTYTVMIGGYCKEGKLARAEMLFFFLKGDEMLLGRMVEQGLAPNTNTYTTLIDGHCKGEKDRFNKLTRCSEWQLVRGCILIR
ncbi:hypothetical protein PVAP13_8KG312700 [Panicum virgatum]|nr:hypothetical protein PVAP13_8KG312700 [Panicum virgatum]KAG2563266.1 hypothetical protein PVAP13_8KG312700 [Panicum virgatum]KAG2563267.1 hypothetical protein PVAP13_8KG312700 [Panicum virgatum]